VPPTRLWGDIQKVKRKVEEKPKKSKALSLEHKASRVSERVRKFLREELVK
jgi:hypothetical protein